MNSEYNAALKFYQELHEKSTEEEIDGIKTRIFRGGLVEVFRTLRISQSYYSKSVDSLKALGCLTLIRRGARSSPSVVALHHAPDEIEWMLRRDVGDLTGSPEGAKLLQRLSDVEKLLGGINVVSALRDVEDRLKALERKTGGKK